MPEETAIAKSAQQQALSMSNTQSLMEAISRAAADPAVDADKMERLLAMAERIMARESEAAFNAAIARISPRLPRITKRGKIIVQNQERSRYALYEDIDSAIRPLLAEEGFSLSFDSDGSNYMGTLSHAVGHKRTARTTLPTDTSGSKNSVQAIGSTVSYAKRYLLGMLLNIITVGEDDDGRAAGFITEEQVRKIEDLLQAIELDEIGRKRFLAFAQADRVSEIQASMYDACYTQLMKKLSQVMAGARK